jgi:hypothetical protein
LRGISRPRFAVILSIVGLDTAGEHRLLDQQSTYGINC